MHPATRDPIRSNTEIPITTGIHQLQMTEEKDLDTSLSGTLHYQDNTAMEKASVIPIFS